MLLRYPGGKGKVSGRLIDLSPPFFIEYREVCCGNAYMLWEVPTYVHRWINDKSVPLINYFQCLQNDPAFVGRLDKLRTYSIPYLGSLFEDASHRITELEGLGSVDDIRGDRLQYAIDYILLMRGSTKHLFTFEHASNPSFMGAWADELIPPLHRIEEARRIMQGVKITNLDYKKVLMAPVEGPTWSYIDPPYYIPRVKDLYDHVFYRRDFRLLRNCIRHLPSDHKFLMTLEDGNFSRQMYWREFHCQSMPYVSGLNNTETAHLLIANYPLCSNILEVR